MTIAYLLDDTLDKADGVQQCVITIGEYMRSLGHVVHYLVASTDRTDLKNVHSLTKYIDLKFNGNSVRTPTPASTKVIKRKLDIIQPDVIHVQMPYSPFFAGKVISSANKETRIVGTWHTFPTGGVQYISHYPLYWLIRSTLTKIVKTIGVSKPTADFADRIYKTNSIVIPNAVDIHRFKVLVKKSDKKRIVYLGRFDERKGPLHLINALKMLKVSGFDMSNIEVVMGGKGPDLEKCKAKAKEYGLDIDFPGFISEEEKPKFLASADISVFPSTGGEAFGISLVEAMASGSSVVLGGDNEGYRSILGKFPDLLFDPIDPDALASKLHKYFDLNTEDAQKIKKDLEVEANQYDVTEVCSQLLKTYTII